MNLEDTLTRFLRSITTSFGTNHPIRFTLCICAGASILAVVKIFAAVYPNEKVIEAAAGLPVYYYIALALLLNFGVLRLRNNIIPEKIDDHISTVEKLIEKANVSPEMRRQIWRTVINKYVQDINVQKDIEGLDLENIARRTISDMKSD